MAGVKTTKVFFHFFELCLNESQKMKKQREGFFEKKNKHTTQYLLYVHSF